MKSQLQKDSLSFTGERVIIDSHEVAEHLKDEHLDRYRFAYTFAQGKRILDIACGTGYGSHMLSSAGAKSVTGIDISLESIEYARRFESNNLTFSQGNALSLKSIKDNSFDLVVSFETIEHLNDPRRFLSELRRILKSGGILIISTPNRHFTSPFYWLNHRPRNRFHIFELNPREFRSLLSEFFLVDSVYGQHLLPSWISWWPVLSLLKVSSLLFSRRDKIYGRIVTHGGTGVFPLTSGKSGRILIALCNRR